MLRNGYRTARLLHRSYYCTHLTNLASSIVPNLPGKRNVRANINRIKTTRSVGGAHGEKAKAAAGDGDGDARTERDMNTSRGGSGTQRKRVGRGERELGTEECTRTPAARCADPYPAPAGASAPTTERGRARTTARHGPVPSPSAFQQSRSKSNSDVALALSPGPRHGTRPQPNPTQAEVGEGGCAAHPTARVDHTSTRHVHDDAVQRWPSLPRSPPAGHWPHARPRARSSFACGLHARSHARVAHS